MARATDAEILTLTKERKGQAVIDDEVARKTARIYVIFYAGTPYILMRAVLEKSITKERVKHAVNDMVSSGWRCNVEIYVKIIEAFEKTWVRTTQALSTFQLNGRAGRI